ncbi:MAG: hypothetical protein HYU64_06530 [Armatimonadetes bacterium]|nr:hypothetical protein [Armatimonadota bacterium]
MDFLDKVGEQVSKVKQRAVRESERFTRLAGLNLDIKSLEREKQERPKKLAYRVYEMYTRNLISDQDLIAICQEVKTVQWQIDEKRAQVDEQKRAKF